MATRDPDTEARTNDGSARRFPPTPTTPASLRTLLRERTALSHRRLEDTLDLLGGPPERERFRRLLCGFHGFHRSWEPAVAARLADEALLAPRRRLPLLEADLDALGMSADEREALPRCGAAAALCDDEAGAIGSLYVMEGSTLGGRTIARHLAGAPWLPAGGLRYFDPHGAETGQRWRETIARLDALPPAQWERAAASAERCFELLREWLGAVALQESACPN